MKSSSATALSFACLLAACAPSEKTNHAAQNAQMIQAAENLKQSGDTAGAVRVLREAEASQPGDPIILSQLGYALVSAGQPQEAVVVFDRLIALHPNDVSAYNGKAVSLDRTGNHAAAQELYRQALTLSPESMSLKNNLAMSMILNDQVPQAITLLEELNRQPGANQTVRQNLALAYGIQGDKQKALALNLQDLPEDDAKENMRFYEHYAKEHKKLAARSVKIPTVVASAPVDLPQEAARDTDTSPGLSDLFNEVLAPVTTALKNAGTPAPSQPEAKAENKVEPTPENKDEALLPMLQFPFHVALTPDPNTTYPSQSKPSPTVLPTAASAAAALHTPPAVALDAPATPAKETTATLPLPTMAETAPAAAPEKEAADKMQNLIPTAGAQAAAVDEADNDDAEATPVTLHLPFDLQVTSAVDATYPTQGRR